MPMKLLDRVRVFHAGATFTTTMGVYRLDAHLRDFGFLFSKKQPGGEWKKVPVYDVGGYFRHIGESTA